MKAKNHLKLSLVGVSDCAATLKAKVWLDLQKIEYKYFDLEKIDEKNIGQADSSVFSENTAIELQVIIDELKNLGLDDQDNLNSSSQSTHYNKQFGHQNKLLELPIILLKCAKKDSQYKMTYLLSGFCANKYLDFINQHF